MIWTTKMLSAYIDYNFVKGQRINISDYNSGYTFPIFGRRWRTQTVDALMQGKLFFLDLSFGNEKHTYYPVLRKADSKPGLYDVINQEFLVNQGSGEFLYN